MRPPGGSDPRVFWLFLNPVLAAVLAGMLIGMFFPLWASALGAILVGIAVLAAGVLFLRETSYSEGVTLGAMGTAALGIAIAVAIPARSDYQQRKNVAAAIAELAPLRARVEMFHKQHGRLPQSAEAVAFRLAPPALQQAQSIAWDPARAAIVVVVAKPESGNRLGLFAETAAATLAWKCKSIDLAPKYLPTACR